MQRLILCVAFLGIGAGNLEAAPIVYKFTGSSEGRLDGVFFSDTPFEFILTGDTTSVQKLGGGLFHNLASSVTFNITGIASGDLLDVYEVFAFNPSSAAGFMLQSSQLDRVDVIDAPALASYRLKTSIGPVTGSSFLVGQFNDDPTTAGTLNLFNGHDVYFEAITAATPEPSTLTLAAIGMVSIGAMARRKRGRSA